MSFVFPPKAPAAVPVFNSADQFPVHRIYCVGRNYVEHAKEMGFTGREAPFFFQKPADSILPVPYGATGEMPYPPMTSDLHHEIELVVAIGKAGRNIAAADAQQHIWGYAVGLDMTRRDLQGEAKKLGRPWDTGKAFDLSAPIAPLHPVTQTGPLNQGGITLKVNGEMRQNSDVDKLIWNVAETIEHLSKYFELQPGDLIYTGTPEGVAAVKQGDLLEGAIAGLGELKVRIV
ncbi:fumarylpyruvate hydrolase [Noviherbaspirillum humi]|uniref:Fumarylpyruvate hydrolase n=1 Tax=Noviherbaspirillum humi TaxID=1688639 RepID=A0A239DY26_9BURK|nr:fumarylacetoacetate hydrolase family protein [Noviherbaspirillum humi]SNS36623.1 fumarylpyruvate hydrolase [Noviherbaspirillum humi]